MSKKKVNRLDNILGEKQEVNYSEHINKHIESNTPKVGRPKKPESANRIKLTTSVDSNLIKKAKIRAVTEEITLADLIEKSLREYLE